VNPQFECSAKAFARLYLIVCTLPELKRTILTLSHSA
jgi:hypothetical protein